MTQSAQIIFAAPGVNCPVGSPCCGSVGAIALPVGLLAYVGLLVARRSRR